MAHRRINSDTLVIPRGTPAREYAAWLLATLHAPIVRDGPARWRASFSYLRSVMERMANRAPAETYSDQEAAAVLRAAASAHVALGIAHTAMPELLRERWSETSKPMPRAVRNPGRRMDRRASVIWYETSMRCAMAKAGLPEPPGRMPADPGPNGDGADRSLSVRILPAVVPVLHLAAGLALAIGDAELYAAREIPRERWEALGLRSELWRTQDDTNNEGRLLERPAFDVLALLPYPAFWRGAIEHGIAFETSARAYLDAPRSRHKGAKLQILRLAA